MKYEQLDLFTVMRKRVGLYDPRSYAKGYEYMAFMENSNAIDAMLKYKEYITEQISLAESKEKRNAWENALKSIIQQISDFEELLKERT